MEQNSLVYLEYIFKEEESLSDKALGIFEECNTFLSKFKTNTVKFHVNLLILQDYFGYLLQNLFVIHL